LDLQLARINNLGTVTFQGRINGSPSGIFVGPDPENDREGGVGDALFGSTVDSITGLDVNHRGDISCTYVLDNGQQGVAVAVIPEPAGLMLAAGSLFLSNRRPG
jgi:hypothetical protein